MDGTVSRCAPELRLGPDGWWISERIADVSYPDSGNTLCLLVEDSSFWFQHRNGCILELIRIFPPPGVVFDVGGGNGCVALAIQESGFDVVLVEPGLEGVRNAVRRGVRQVVQSTLEDAGVLAGTLPAVGLFDVIEHVRDDLGFLKSTKDLMIREGRIYITAPAYQALWSDEDVLAGHFRRYRLRDLVHIMEAAGFAVEFGTYFFRFLPIPIFISRVLPYRLRLGGKQLSEAAMRADHEVRNGLAASALRIAMQRELSRIRMRHPLGYGASCLLVARKRA